LRPSLPIPPQGAHLEPEAEGIDQQPIGFEQKVKWLEQELLKLGPEPSASAGESGAVEQEPRTIAEEPAAIDEAQSSAVQGAEVTGHDLGTGDPAPTAFTQEAHGPVDLAPASRAQRPHAIGPVSGPSAVGLGNTRSASGHTRIPAAQWLFSELADESRSQRREYMAGGFAVLLVLTIAAGGYFYYREKLSLGVAVLERGEPTAGAPSRETRAGAMGRSSAASTPPLTKDASESVGPEPVLAAQPVKKSAIAKGLGKVQQQAPAASSATRETDAATAMGDAGSVAAAPVPDPQSAVTSGSRCPPAVAAIALCDWITAHASGK